MNPEKPRVEGLLQALSAWEGGGQYINRVTTFKSESAVPMKLIPFEEFESTFYLNSEILLTVNRGRSRQTR